VRAYIFDVREEPRGPQIFLSRSHPQFMAKLFMQEVPEIYDGIIEIKAVARDPGSRAKIAVLSHDSAIDPIGACVGQKGVRIQAVMEEINGERVDMLEWSDDPIKLISTALQPASISAVIIVNDQEAVDADGRKVKKRAAVFVEEAQRPMAIGKKGQNIRLATDLTGYELDMYNYEELPAFQAKLAELRGEDVPVAILNDAGDESTEAPKEETPADESAAA